ncbi:hypothetical protein ACHAXT_011875 [Thalassiosira profunda]
MHTAAQMSALPTVAAALLAAGAAAEVAFHFLPARPSAMPSTSPHPRFATLTAQLSATRERAHTGRGTRWDNGPDAFGDFDDGYGDFEDDFEEEYNPQRSRRSGPSHSRNNHNNNNSVGETRAAPSTFYSQKSLSDPSFNDEDDPFFRELCAAANIQRPSKIQSLAWPPLLRGENAVVADQTGSGKTLAYLLPLLQRLHQSDAKADATKTARKHQRTGSPRIVVLTPTAELADQIHSVCTLLSKDLDRTGDWSFNPFVTTATGSKSTNIRDQIRLLQTTPVDVLISTPGRLSTILRTKNAGLDLGHVTSLVLDEVDFLLVDETFGPQLRTVGVAVQGGDADGSDDGAESNGPQFLFVTATLPEDVLESIKTEFPNLTQLRGPGLHRITPAVQQTLVDVSVPATSNRDQRACFDIKVREMLKALRARRCSKTLIFCNTVETCRNVENVLKRKDKKGRRNRVWAYHNALGPEVRLKNLRAFSCGDGNDDDSTERILVCTDRAARGIDFDSSPVDHVLLFDFPKDPAEYVRRVGRTARAGRTGASTVLAYGWQLPIARKIMGLSGSSDKKGKKKGDARLESFTMMRSSDGWDEEDQEWTVKQRMANKASRGGGAPKKKPKRRGDKGKAWK